MDCKTQELIKRKVSGIVRRIDQNEEDILNRVGKELITELVSHAHIEDRLHMRHREVINKTHGDAYAPCGYKVEGFDYLPDHILLVFWLLDKIEEGKVDLEKLYS